jgi:hypothetical protein
MPLALSKTNEDGSDEGIVCFYVRANAIPCLALQADGGKAAVVGIRVVLVESVEVDDRDRDGGAGDK